MNAAVAVACAAVACAAVAIACGPELSFRAYLGTELWHPARRDLRDVLRGLPPENEHRQPYAGMATAGGGAPLQAARDAYRALFPAEPDPYSNTLNWPSSVIDHVRDLVNAVRPATAAERDEVDLLHCKVELRAAKPDDTAALETVRSCFDAYSTQARPVAFASEARGWKARLDHLLGHDSAAATFYLTELSAPASNISRDRLFKSLLYITPAESDLDGYLDTPAHALFIVDRVTNNSDYASLAGPLITRLEQHRDLFRSGADGDALVTALMRLSMRMGTPDAVLRYADRLRPDSPTRASPDYNWMLGAARYQQRDYAAAEAPLKTVVTAADASEEQRALAANTLIGVYARLRRPVDQLWAAFAAANTWIVGEILDASYLLDVQLTGAELSEFLRRYADAPQEIQTPGRTTSLDAVNYERAVRFARAEKYDEAARLYESLNPQRAARMKEAGALFAATRASGASPASRLQALYDYASFLADHEDGIFFNDLAWRGFQTAAFVYRNPDKHEPDWAAANVKMLTADERTRFAAVERRLRDEQEEYWRAYKILDRVVRDAGSTPLGRKAAERAIYCLRKISQDRFGRAAEIRAADIRLSAWLTRHGAARP